MAENYKIIYKEGTGELVEKKSRFIAQIRPVKSEEEALAFVEETRKKYWDARHNCYAYIIKGEGATPTARCSDDGEPSQTAGKPMLDVLMGEGLMDVCAVVTRYFGGTLLNQWPGKGLFRGSKRRSCKCPDPGEKTGSSYGSDHRLQWGRKDPVSCSTGRH